jgi:hypothetical protein
MPLSSCARRIRRFRLARAAATARQASGQRLFRWPRMHQLDPTVPVNDEDELENPTAIRDLPFKHKPVGIFGDTVFLISNRKSFMLSNHAINCIRYQDARSGIDISSPAIWFAA